MDSCSSFLDCDELPSIDSSFVFMGGAEFSDLVFESKDFAFPGNAEVFGTIGLSPESQIMYCVDHNGEPTNRLLDQFNVDPAHQYFPLILTEQRWTIASSLFRKLARFPGNLSGGNRFRLERCFASRHARWSVFGQAPKLEYSRFQTICGMREIAENSEKNVYCFQPASYGSSSGRSFSRGCLCSTRAMRDECLYQSEQSSDFWHISSVEIRHCFQLTERRCYRC